MKRMLIAACIAVLLAFSPVAHAAPARSGGAVAGAIGGTTLEVYDLAAVQKLVAANKGKVVAINFFATWCPPCLKEIPGLMRIRKAIGKEKLILIGVSVDKDESELRAFIAKTKFNYPVGRAGMDLAAAAGVSHIPHLLVFDAKGTVAANQPGYVAEEDLQTFIQGLLE